MTDIVTVLEDDKIIVVSLAEQGLIGATGPTGATGPAGTSDHLVLTNIGINSHATIDTHLSNSALHIPSMTGNSGKYLTTDGSVSSWATVSTGLTEAQVQEIAIAMAIALGN